MHDADRRGCESWECAWVLRVACCELPLDLASAHRSLIASAALSQHHAPHLTVSRLMKRPSSGLTPLTSRMAEEPHPTHISHGGRASPHSHLAWRKGLTPLTSRMARLAWHATITTCEMCHPHMHTSSHHHMHTSSHHHMHISSHHHIHISEAQITSPKLRSHLRSPDHLSRAASYRSSATRALACAAVSAAASASLAVACVATAASCF